MHTSRRRTRKFTGCVLHLNQTTIHTTRSRPLLCYVISHALALGMHIDAQRNNASILESAVIDMRIDIVRLALAHGADINVSNGFPLKWCRCHDPRFIRMREIGDLIESHGRNYTRH